MERSLTSVRPPRPHPPPPPFPPPHIPPFPSHLPPPPPSPTTSPPISTPFTPFPLISPNRHSSHFPPNFKCRIVQGAEGKGAGG